jgi:hypothetical protein
MRNGVSLAGDVNAAVAGNVGERSKNTHVSSQQDAAQTNDRRKHST